jgi:glycosyltransferase involved in cell wall biosynthesis
MPVKHRVIIVNDYGTECGGASNVAVRQARGLAARGHDVLLFSAVAPPAPPEQDGVHHHSCGQFDLLGNPSRMAAAVQGLWNRQAARQLTAVLQDSDPQSTIIHLHSWTKALSSSVVATIAGSGLPAVCTLHDYFVACPNGGFFNYQTSTVCALTPLSWSCVSCHCDARHYGHKLWRVARQVVQQQAAGMPRRLRHFICVSPFNRELIQRYLPADSHIYVLPSAVELDAQPPLPATQRDTIVFVGRLAREKGVVTYLEACRLAGITPVLLGDGELAPWIRTHYPEARISGWLPARQLHQALRKALALAFPSLAYEAQPLTILEAAALGVPAIVSRHCAGASYVEPGITGEWITAGNAAELATVMNRLSGNRSQAAQMGKTAYDRFWSSGEYRSEDWLARLEQIYAECVADQGQAA